MLAKISTDVYINTGDSTQIHAVHFEPVSGWHRVRAGSVINVIASTGKAKFGYYGDRVDVIASFFCKGAYHKFKIPKNKTEKADAIDILSNRIATGL